MTLKKQIGGLNS